MSFFGIPMRNGLSLGLGTVASLTNGPPFLPSELFYNGTVQGAWYDPSDLTTLYQDSAGTTPVTAVEQPVGLMLDKSKGLVLGSEVVVSPYTGSASGTWAVSATSVTRNSSTGGQASVNLGAAISTSKYYLVTFVVSNLSGDDFFFRIGGGGTAYRVSANGTYTARVVGGGTSSSITFAPWAGGAGEVTIANISIRELPGNHAYQTTSASRPTLRARYNLLTRSEEFNDAAWTRVNANITANAGVAPDGTTTADSLVATTTGPQLYQTFTIADSTIVTASVYLKKVSGSDWAYIRIREKAGANYFFWANLVTGAAGSTSGSPTAFSVSSVGNGWYRLTLSGSSNTGATTPFVYVSSADANGSGNALNGDSILVWGAQLTIPAVFPSNTYQRVGAATDYATGAAFPPYLFCDGTDDSMLTNSVDFATVTSDGQARRNLLTLPNQFGVTPWVLDGSSVSLNSAVAPDGTTTASTITGTSGNFRIYQQAASNIGSTYTISVYAKQGTSPTLQIDYVNVDTGPVFTFATASFSVRAGFTTSVQDVGNGWYRLVVTRANLNANPGPGFVVSGATTVFLWNAQYELGSTATAFQNIGTDKMLVVAGVTKQSDAALGVVAETSSDSTVNNGSWWLLAPYPANYYSSLSRGTSFTLANSTNVADAAPTSSVLSEILNISAPLNQLRVNGVVRATNTATQGTGNFGNYPLYIGRRNNATLPFNGNIYSLVIAGQSYTAGQISSTESWVAAKTPLGTI